MSDPLALVSVLAGVISLSGTVISSSLTLRDTVDLLRARWVAKIKVGHIKDIGDSGSGDRILTVGSRRRIATRALRPPHSTLSAAFTTN